MQTTFPAPYRADVFERLKAHFYIFVAYENFSDAAHHRHTDWYATHLGPDSVVVKSRGGRRRYALAKKRLREYDAALIYEYSTPMAMLLMLACLRQGVPYLINVDGGFIHNNPVKNIVKTFFVRRARACLAGSESAERYLRAFGAKPSDIYRHNFSNLSFDDLRQEPLNPQDKVATRRSLNLPPQGPIFIAVGQFIPRKGFDVLLDAWPDFDTTATLVLMGGGPEASRYQNLIVRNGLHNVILRGFGDKETVFSYYQASDCFVLPTREDVWGLVVNEAMACALPVITTNRCIAGVELIEQGVNGFTVDPEDPVALAGAMRAIIQDRELRHAMAEANIEKISSYTVENVAQSHADSIEHVLRGEPCT